MKKLIVFIFLLSNVFGELKYSDVIKLANTEFTLIKKDGKYGVRNDNGIIIEPIYEDIGFANEKYIIVDDRERSKDERFTGKGKGMGIYTHETKTLIFPNLLSLNYLSSNLFVGEGKVRDAVLIDNTGKLLLTFDVNSFCYNGDNTYVFSKKSKFGLINGTGTILLEPIYDKISKFKNGISFLVKGDEYSIINLKGDIIKIGDGSVSSDFNYILEQSNTDSVDYLTVAAKNDNVKFVEPMLKLGAELNKEVILTIFDSHSVNVLDFILKSNYVIPEKFIPGNTEKIIETALRKNKFKSLEYLASLKGGINNLFIDNKTLLTYAIEEDISLEVIKTLISKGADVNKKDKEGETPLISACKSDKNINIVKVLVDNGAKLEERNNEGYTAFLMASKNSSDQIKSYLLSIGADKNVVDNKGINAKGLEKLHKKELNYKNRIFNENYRTAMIGMGEKGNNDFMLDLTYGKANMENVFNSYLNVGILQYGLGLKLSSKNKIIGYFEIGGGYYGLIPLQLALDFGVTAEGEFYFGQKVIGGISGIYLIGGIEKIKGNESYYFGIGSAFSY